MLYLPGRPVTQDSIRTTRTPVVAAVLAALPLLAGCSRLPEFAEPKSSAAGAYDPDSGGDLVRYRSLERGDFRRKIPPEVTKQGPYELGAMTCAHVRTNPDVRINIVSTTDPGGKTRHEGRLSNLKFFAYMDRDCSWWNPTNDDVPYTLEHEQIHFAISELEARGLNQESQKLMRELRVTGDSKEEIVAKVQKELNELLEEHNEEALDRNREFDEETSVGKNPTRQREWRKTVERELEATEAWR
ncbi:MAG TPA: hypothetical protein VGK73_00170 [Polyangiaceae bacterium]